MNKDIQTQKKASVALVDQLIVISMFLQRMGNRQVARLGLKQSHFAVLGEITRNRNISQKDILGEYLLEKSNLSKIIKKLEQMSLITVAQTPGDHRKSLLNATAAGRALYRKGIQHLNQLKERFASPLKEKELRSILPAVDTLANLVRFHQHNRKEIQNEQ